MSPDEARALFLEHCEPGDRGTMERYGAFAATSAICSVTDHIEAEARRLASAFSDNSSASNTLIILADMVAALTAEKLARLDAPE